MRRAVLALGLLVCTALVVIMGSRRWADQTLDERSAQTVAIRVVVPPGATLRAVLADLEGKGVLHRAPAVELALRVRGGMRSIRAGEYQILPHASPREILEQLATGRVILEQLTIVEGWTFADMRRALEAHPGLRATQRGRSDDEVMAMLGHRGEHPEGRFQPDTYRFAAGTSDRAILALAYDAMAKDLAAQWPDRAPDLPLRSPYEALILASIVEKETGLAAERPRIAGVFLERLRRGMRLQSDPTVIYGLGDRYDGDIRSRDLVTDTPYNTYTRTGLPPTPIALPGRDALRAVLRPQLMGELYFVATGAGDGSHHFSRSLEEHNAAVRRYLARLRAGSP